MAVSTVPAEVNLKQRYGKVIILLENCILPPDKLSPTPSLSDGLENDYEVDLRILGCDLIQTSGILLKLPQVAMATGQVLFQRFYYSKSFVRHTMEVVAMSCITLASKIEESPRRIRDVINVFHHIKQVKAGKNIQPLILDQNYINLKNQVIKGERRVLKELGFCVHVKHPHKVIVTLLQVLECEKNQRLMQTSWNYMNDCLRCDVFVRYSPEAIACACISLSARLLKIPLPTKPVWYSLFGVSEDDVQGISLAILRLYARPKPDLEKLDEIVEDLKKSHQEAKLRARGLAGNATPIANSAGFSPASQQNSPKKSSVSDNRKEDSHAASSPKIDKESNHVNSHKHNSRSSPSPIKRDRSRSSSLGSKSSTPKRKAKTPPRGYKEPLRSRSHSRDRKENKHRNSHKRNKRSRSPSRSKSRSRSPHWRGTNRNKKLYKEKVVHKARSQSRDANRHHVSSKSTKPRKVKEYVSHRSRSHSRERNRR